MALENVLCDPSEQLEVIVPLLYPALHPFPAFAQLAALLQNRPIQLFFIAKMSEQKGFVDLCRLRQLPGRCSSKPLAGKQLLGYGKYPLFALRRGNTGWTCEGHLR